MARINFERRYYIQSPLIVEGHCGGSSLHLVNLFIFLCHLAPIYYSPIPAQYPLQDSFRGPLSNTTPSHSFIFCFPSQPPSSRMRSIDSFVTKNQDNLALWASFGSSILFVYHLLSDGSFSFLMVLFENATITISSAILFAVTLSPQFRAFWSIAST